MDVPDDVEAVFIRLEQDGASDAFDIEIGHRRRYFLGLDSAKQHVNSFDKSE